MKTEWFFDRFCGMQVAVCTEDGRIAEVNVENDRGKELLGNIHKGRVQSVVSGMQAAFVSFGLERNGYLPLDEGGARFSTYDGEGRLSERPALKAGDEILVQIEKLPRGNKGAKLTTDLSFVGKNLIFLPQTDFLGISRKITDGQMRETLLGEADKFREGGEGFIVRTAAQTATKRSLKTEAEYLRRMYRSVLEAAKDAPVGAVVYRECDLPVKVMRDSLGGGVHKIYVGEKKLYERVLRLARMRSDLGEKKVSLYDGERSMFSHFGLAERVLELAEPRVPLKSGGYLVIDRTEAMTVVDVNTGKFTGDLDLESTVYETNLEAAKEIARQVRLRNIGGIVTVDFIDMGEEKHRTDVDRALVEALSEDRAKCRVFPMGELCVTLFTRKRINNELLTFLLKPCPHCTREGYVLSDRYMAMRVRTEIMQKFSEGYGAAVVELNRALMKAILAEGFFSEELNGRWKDKRIYMVPHTTYHEEQFSVRGDNARVLELPDNAQILY